ncbi:MAG TPA: TonB-dependent receptor [Caulobacteraceae bacterium]|nr:TonB-dependent receptor [Caulobacteraceae bacterium]
MPADLPPPIDTVVVHAARLPASPADAAFAVVQVSPQDLASTPRLDKVLETSPGASLFRPGSSAGANPTTQGISLRSVAPSAAGRALVTLDGVPQNDPFGGWVIWSSLPTESIGDIRIVRGSGAGPYGAGALTGVIDLQERTLPSGGVAGEISGGSRGGARGAAVGEVQTGPVNLFGSFSAEQGDHWIPVVQGRGRADDDLTLHAWNGAGRAQVELGRTVIAAHVGAYEESRDSGLVNAISRSRGQDASITAAAQPTNDQLGWRLQGWVRHSDLLNTSVSTAADRNSTTPSNNQYATPATGWGVNAAVRKTGDWGDLEAGADLRSATGKDHELFTFVSGAYTKNRLAGGGQAVAGLYVEGARSWSGWLLTGGVRIDSWRQTNSRLIERTISTGAVTLNSPSPNKSGSEPTGRIALRRDLSDSLYLRAAAYTGFRQPSLNELNRPFRVGNNITLANALLRPERLTGFEGGVGGRTGPVKWSATLFDNRVTNPVINATIGVGPGTFPIAGVVPAGGILFQRQNVAAINAYGLEADAEAHPLAPLTVKVSGAYTDAEVDGGAAARQLTGKRPALAPKFTGTASAAWALTPSWAVSSSLRYESQRFDDDLNTLIDQPFLAADLRTDYTVTPNFGVYLAVINVGDAAIVTARAATGVASYDLPRTVRVGLTFRR